MHHVVRVGPIEVKPRAQFAYLAVAEDGVVQLVLEHADSLGLAALRRKLPKTAALVCEPALDTAARALGLGVAPPPREVAMLKAALAVTLAHGPMLSKVDPELVLALVEATVAFAAAEPWHAFEPDEVLTVELGPEPELREACVMGQGGEEFGLAIYHEPGSVAKLMSAPERASRRVAMSLPCTTVLLEDASFSARAVGELGGPAIAPQVLQIARGQQRPTSAREVAVLVGALRATTALAATGRPITAEAPGGLTVRVARTREPSVHGRDHQIVEAILELAAARFGTAAMNHTLDRELGHERPTAQLAAPLIAYLVPFDGKPLAAHYLEASASIGPDERRWIELQLATRLTIWEVLRVEPGRGVEVIDLLGDERVFVHELRASQVLLPRLAVLGRVVRDGETPVFCGMHEIPLPPDDVDAIVRAAPTSLRALVERWSAAVREADRKAALPSTATNTDGEPVVLVEDHFAIGKAKLARTIDALAALEDVVVDERRPGRAALTFVRAGNRVHRAWQNTVIGTASLTATKLVVATNSLARADALLARVRDAVGSAATYQRRTRAEMPVPRGGRELVIDSQAVAAPPDPLDVECDFLDGPLAILDGRSPREAVADAGGRAAVHRLLKDQELHHARAPGATDPAVLRRVLGLDELGRPCPHADLDRAMGAGRKLSDALVTVARPILQGTSSLAAFEDVLAFTSDAWNATVLEVTDEPGALAGLRAKLTPAEREALDTVVARKQRYFSDDRRIAGRFRATKRRGGFTFEIESRVPHTLQARLAAAGML